jgi:hypothetical protein
MQRYEKYLIYTSFLSAILTPKVLKINKLQRRLLRHLGTSNWTPYFYIQIFEGKKVRIVWDAEKEKYYFAVADIVQVLTDTVNPRDYIKKMLRRDPELKSKWGTICPPVEMIAPDGKRRKNPT